MNKFYKLVEGLISKWAIEDGKIQVKWRTGGITGGNCWGGKANRPVDGEPEPEFESLDKILAEICPTISFLQYKRLCQAIVKTDSDTEYEYYGNSYTYGIRSCSITDLEEYLKENNLWDESAH